MRFDGIDYAARPTDLFDMNAETLHSVTCRIKGTNRQEMTADYYVQGRLAELDPANRAESVPGARLDFLGSISPSFLGGEYLDDFLEGEVEVGRIVLGTVHLDTISLRARPSADHTVLLRVVDEYGTDFQLTGDRLPGIPSLGELVDWMVVQAEENGGLILKYVLEAVQEGDAPHEAQQFVRFRSYAYPGLVAHAEAVVADWIARGAPLPENADDRGDSTVAEEEEAGLAGVIVHAQRYGLKRMKVRTLMSIVGYKRRSEQNADAITRELLERGAVVVPTLLKLSDSWHYDIDQWVTVYPQYHGALFPDDAKTVADIVRSGKKALPSTLVDDILQWGEVSPGDPEPPILLYLLADFLETKEVPPLTFAQEVVRRAPELATAWVCIGHYVTRGGYDNAEALSAFYRVEQYGGTLFERAYALSWIRELQARVDARRYVRQAERKLDQLASARIANLPTADTLLVDVLYPDEIRIES